MASFAAFKQSFSSNVTQLKRRFSSSGDISGDYDNAPVQTAPPHPVTAVADGTVGFHSQQQTPTQPDVPGMGRGVAPPAGVQAQQQPPQKYVGAGRGSRTVSAPTSPTRTPSVQQSFLQRMSSITSAAMSKADSVSRAVGGVAQYYNKEKCRNLLVIDGPNTDWSKYFRGRKLPGDYDIRVEQAEFQELSIHCSSETGTTVSMGVQRGSSKVVRSFRPDFVLMRQNLKDAGEDHKNILLGLKFGDVPCVNSLTSIYNFQDKPWVFAHLLDLQRKLGKDNFPLIEQNYYPNWKEMASIPRFPVVLKIGHAHNGLGKVRVENAPDFQDLSSVVAVADCFCTTEPYIDAKYDIHVQKIGSNYKAFMRKSMCGSWKTNLGSSLLEQIPVTDKWKMWMDNVAEIFGGLDLCSIEAVVGQDGREYIIEVNDSSLPLLGESQEEDRKHISDLVMQKMQHLFLHGITSGSVPAGRSGSGQWTSFPNTEATATTGGGSLRRDSHPDSGVASVKPQPTSVEQPPPPIPPRPSSRGPFDDELQSPPEPNFPPPSLSSAAIGKPGVSREDSLSSRLNKDLVDKPPSTASQPMANSTTRLPSQPQQQGSEEEDTLKNLKKTFAGIFGDIVVFQGGNGDYLHEAHTEKLTSGFNLFQAVRLLLRMMVVLREPPSLQSLAVKVVSFEVIEPLLTLCDPSSVPEWNAVSSISHFHDAFASSLFNSDDSHSQCSLLDEAGSSLGCCGIGSSFLSSSSSDESSLAPSFPSPVLRLSHPALRLLQNGLQCMTLDVEELNLSEEEIMQFRFPNLEKLHLLISNESFERKHNAVGRTASGGSGNRFALHSRQQQGYMPSAAPPFHSHHRLPPVSQHYDPPEGDPSAAPLQGYPTVPLFTFLSTLSFSSHLTELSLNQTTDNIIMAVCLHCKHLRVLDFRGDIRRKVTDVGLASLLSRAQTLERVLMNPEGDEFDYEDRYFGVTGKGVAALIMYLPKLTHLDCEVHLLRDAVAVLREIHGTTRPPRTYLLKSYRYCSVWMDSDAEMKRQRCIFQDAVRLFPFIEKVSLVRPDGDLQETLAQLPFLNELEVEGFWPTTMLKHPRQKLGTQLKVLRLLNCVVEANDIAQITVCCINLEILYLGIAYEYQPMEMIEGDGVGEVQLAYRRLPKLRCLTLVGILSRSIIEGLLLNESLERVLINPSYDSPSLAEVIDKVFKGRTFENLLEVVLFGWALIELAVSLTSLIVY
ncbi:unnamed protein product [Cyprideis torosa]|uniref:Uncharacterized protein n=1 Tax=Cyprideis torosa TaxID=163714 RepID=A0A7R8W7I9_9CRUS|nr:unnamed protein product [Cyprideis torosa]CAG0883298.1 unnamed protein product [Cyprideis torosa]